MDDAKLVDMYLSRNQDAIKYTSEKYGKIIHGISYKITEDEGVASECENDTYFEAWKIIPPNDPRNYFLRFLSKIVRNISLNRCIKERRQKRYVLLSELTKELEETIDGGHSADEEILGKELAELISSFLESVSEQKRIIFIRRYYYFDKLSEISEKSGVSENAVKTMLFRIRCDLKKYLAERGY